MMNSYLSVVKKTEEFLRKKRIKTTIEVGRKLDGRRIIALEKSLKRPLPKEFSNFYNEIGDQFLFQWSKSPEFDKLSSGMIAIPTPEVLADQFEKRSKHTAWMSEKDAFVNCVDAEYHDAAAQIVQRMKSWLPFWKEGNGDQFCIDLATGEVVLDNHSWFDGFYGDAYATGVIAGANFLDFFARWANVCFMCPTSLWWMSLADGPRLSWNPEEFNSRFVIES
jgi:hypothetical protein